MEDVMTFGSSNDYEDPEELKQFGDSDSEKNQILAQDIFKSLNLGKTAPERLRRNNNVFVIGGTGSGKTRSLIEPNIMQMNANYVVTDPKGSTCKTMRPLLEAHGYKVTVFNTIDFAKSDPIKLFGAIQCEDDITRVANALVNCNGNPLTHDELGVFWDNAEKMLYQAVIGYLYECRLISKEMRNEGAAASGSGHGNSRRPRPVGLARHSLTLPAMIDLIDRGEARENDENYKSALDASFETLRNYRPECYAVQQYDRFKHGAGRTLKSVLISCHARLTQYSGTAIRKCLSDEDGFDFASLASNEKRALFIITSDHDSTYSGLLNLTIMQLMTAIIREADTRPNSQLERPVQFMLDELYSIGHIQDLERICSTVRSRNISLFMATQSLAQIDALYGPALRTDILNNCDTLVYLGGGDVGLREFIAREIYPVEDDELYKVGVEDCIVRIKGMRALKVPKYKQENHPRYGEMCALDEICINRKSTDRDSEICEPLRRR